MTNWFIVHSRESYDKHPNLIGFKEKFSKEEETKPVNSYVNLIERDNRIVYYIKNEKIIKGIFKVISKSKRIKNFKDFPFLFEIKPLYLLKKGIDFREIVYNEELDMFKKISDRGAKNMWGSVIQGKNVIKPISEHDYKIILKYVKGEKN